MPIASGVYIITNAQQGNPVYLESPDDEVPLQGHYKPENDSEQWHWHVKDLNNGSYSIQNVKYKRYANCGSRAVLKAHVLGASGEQEWNIRAIDREKEYTIGAIDSQNIWMLPTKGKGTPVELFNVPNDRRCWWAFTSIETGTPVDKDAGNEHMLLFELGKLPILPFSPLKLDFITIQQKCEDSISNVFATIGELCDPLISLSRPQPNAFRATSIEFKCPSSNEIFFYRFFGFLTFETLRNLGDPDIPWKICGGQTLPPVAIRGLRVGATKVAILNLSMALIQQSGQAIITLINALVKHDITLILTPIQPIWAGAFYRSHIFQELKKLSFECRLFEQKDEFSGYVIDYNEVVALPRLAKDRNLRDAIQHNIPHIVEVLKEKDQNTRSAAVAAFSQLAQYTELRDAIFQTITKIVDMLKGDSGEVEAATSALIKLAGHVDLRQVIRQAIPRTREVLKGNNHDARSAVVDVLCKLAVHTELHDAIFPATLKIIQMLKGPSGDLNKTRSRLSRWTIKRGHREVGANFSDSPDWTPLSWVAANGYNTVVHLLLALRSDDVDTRSNLGRTPLSLAAGNGHEAVVCLLMAHEGVNVDSKCMDGRAPLSWAAGNGHEAVVRLLMAHKEVQVDTMDNEGDTPLSWASIKGHEAVVSLLLTHVGVDVNAKGGGGYTPLLWAASIGNEAVVHLLVAHAGVDVNSASNTGRTPLSLAASKGHDAVVCQLLAHASVDVNSKGGTDYTPLLWAAFIGCEAVVRILLAHPGVDVNSTSDTGRTPLSLAASKGHNVVVGLLMAHKDVQVDTKDREGDTPLSWASMKGHEAVVRLLLAHVGVDVNSKGTDGYTPLLWAASTGCEAVVRILLDHPGVDVNSTSDTGRTPLSLAASNGHDAVAKLLREKTRHILRRIWIPYK